jgi:gluconokinase
VVVVMMGVTGSGKTTVGSLLAKQLGWEFRDADQFHTPANIEKMSHGIPLNDADRAPWLAAMHDSIVNWLASGENVVLACSALKRSYREELCVDPRVKIIYLKGSFELISERVRERQGHYAKADLVSSQFADLEEPDDAITLDVSHTPEEIVAEARKRLGLT